jgi:integrase
LLEDNPLFSKEQNPHLNELALTFSKKELDEYVSYRVSLVHQKSGTWLIKASKIFWEITQGCVTKTRIDQLRQFVLSEYQSRDSWGKIFYFAKSFLEYLARTHFDHRFKDFSLFIEKPRMRVERKMLTSRIITVQDVSKTLEKILCAPISTDERINFQTLILFLAYSGQRVVTTSRLTVGQFRHALESNPPVLTVEANQDKIRLQHYVPIHNNLIPHLNDLIGDRKDAEIMFNYNGLMRWLQHNPVPLSRITGNLQLKDLRKFMEQKSDEIGFTDSNKNFIMSHGVSSINWTSYKQFLPENVYARYMDCWGSVKIV